VTTVECVLAIDLGTGGPKVAIVAPDGTVRAWASRPVATVFVGDEGAEQDPNEMWSAIVSATRQVLAAVDASLPASFAAVAVTSQFMSVVPVAADGQPTGPSILWMDGRGAAHNQTLLNDESFMLFVERHGLIPLPDGKDNIAHIDALRVHHPEAYAAAAAFVEPMDYVVARLTGHVTATQSTMFGQLVCDNRAWGAVEYDAELVAAGKLDRARLPPLRPMNGFAGEVRSRQAEELGIAAGIPVAVPSIDSITSAVGSGAIDSTSASIVIGTTSVMVTHVPTFGGDLLSGVLTVPSPLADSYFVMAENGVGGRALEWATRMFGYGDDISAAVDAAATVAAGADGVQFMPWLLGSIAPRPNGAVRAALTGLGLQHRGEHVIRAVLEGVALNLAWLRPEVERFVGANFPFVRFGGGGAQSLLWAQILADAIGLPVHRMAEPRTTNARGAAFLAFTDLGTITTSDIPGLLRVADVVEPQASVRALMDERLATMIRLHSTLGDDTPSS
jgi:xylulokinase